MAQVDVALSGCRPVPLAHYLKALGILRIVAEQADPEARGWWEEDVFWLRSALDADELRRFLLEEYRPTPIVAPWNGGSGFYPNDNQVGIQAIRSSISERFALYRETITVCERLLRQLELTEKPEKTTKEMLLVLVRNHLPDAVVPWVDAAVILTSHGPKYPPLLGTGGNDGHLDFTNNFMQRVVELIDPVSGQPTPFSKNWLDGALDGTITYGLEETAIGQFFPGAVGGPNATTGFEGKSAVNPWDFVLMLEGSLLFSAASSRKLQPGARDLLTAPFTVYPTPVGQGATSMHDENSARAEIWVPLWSRPATLREIAVVFREGRAQVGRRQVRNGLDFARACAMVAVDRGIAEFQRYGFLMRSGKAYLATPLSRFVVRRNPNADLLAEVDGWLNHLQQYVRGKDVPARVGQAMRAIEAAAFAVAQYGGAAQVQRLLMALAGAEQQIGVSSKARAALPPVPRLSPAWWERADDGSVAFRVAKALAGLADKGMGSFRAHWSPIDPQYVASWVKDVPSPWQVWGSGDLVPNLVRVLEKRLVMAWQKNLENKPGEGTYLLDLADLTRWLWDEALDVRIQELVLGLSLITPPTKSSSSIQSLNGGLPIPRQYAWLKVVFSPESDIRRVLDLPTLGRVPIPERLLGLLRAGRLDEAVQLADRRLRASGLSTRPVPGGEAGLDPVRIAASLLLPVTHAGLRHLLRLVTLPAKPVKEVRSIVVNEEV